MEIPNKFNFQNSSSSLSVTAFFSFLLINVFFLAYHLSVLRLVLEDIG